MYGDDMTALEETPIVAKPAKSSRPPAANGAPHPTAKRSARDTRPPGPINTNHRARFKSAAQPAGVSSSPLPVASRPQPPSDERADAEPKSGAESPSAASKAPADAEQQLAAPWYTDPDVRAAAYRQANIIEGGYFPTCLIDSLALGENMNLFSVRVLLARMHDETGDRSDPIAKMLVDQIFAGHLHIAKLRADAAATNDFEFKRLYFNSAARLQSELCKTVQTLIDYRASRPESRPEPKTTTPLQLRIHVAKPPAAPIACGAGL